MAKFIEKKILLSHTKREGGGKAVMEIPTKRPPLKKISDVVWEISPDYKKDKPAMQVPARIYGTKKLIDSMDLMVYEQISNVACLPGIQKAAMCMPDGHFSASFRS
jgi:hypothetical protein